MKDESNKGETHQLKGDKQEIADDQGPLPTVAVTGQAKDDGPDGPEHEHHRDAPCDVRLGAPKRLGEVADGQRDGEEVERVPCLFPPFPPTRQSVWSCLVSSREGEGTGGARHTQALKAMRKNAHCVRFSERRRRHGFGAASIGGLRLLSRVARYRPDGMVASRGGGALLLIPPSCWFSWRP